MLRKERIRREFRGYFAELIFVNLIYSRRALNAEVFFIMDELNSPMENAGGQELSYDVQAVIDERIRVANDRLIAAEIREIGAQIGLVDAEAALALIDRSGVSVDDNGDVSGVREALDALIAAKPYLVGRNVRLGTGKIGNFPRNDSEGGDYASRLAAARSSGNNCLATAIISEAASKGITLR